MKTKSRLWAKYAKLKGWLVDEAFCFIQAMKEFENCLFVNITS